MASYGINPGTSYDVPIPELRRIAKNIGKDHKLAASLWAHGYLETQILASMVDNAPYVTEELHQTNNASARWVARDTILELNGEKVQQKLKSKKAK